MGNLLIPCAKFKEVSTRHALKYRTHPTPALTHFLGVALLNHSDSEGGGNKTLGLVIRLELGDRVVGEGEGRAKSVAGERRASRLPGETGRRSFWIVQKTAFSL